jgi:hypothetical protein
MKKIPPIKRMVGIDAHGNDIFGDVSSHAEAEYARYRQS